MTHLSPVRADATDNRARLLAAGRDAFSAHGLTVPLREVAREADVSPATLYRHFPSKQALAEEAFAGEMAACRDIVRDACARADAWSGFCELVERLCEQHSRNRGFTSALLSTYPEVVDLTAERRELLAAVAGLMQRARVAGDLRQDAEVRDLIIMLQTHRGVIGSSGVSHVAASRRFARLTICAFHAGR